MELFAGHKNSFLWELFHKTFQLVKLGSIYSGVIQSQGIRECLVPVETGVDDRHETDTGSTCDSELFRKRIHGTPDTPCPGSAGQEHQADSSDQSCLYRETCLRNGLVFYMSGIVMPVDIHMIGDDIVFYHNDSFR